MRRSKSGSLFTRRPITPRRGNDSTFCNPLHMELRACVEGLAAAVMGCIDIILESYAVQVVKALLGDD